MIRKPFAFALFSLLVIAAGLLGTSPVYAATDAAVSGEINTIDLATKHITIKKNDNSTVTLKVKKATVIERNGRSVKLKALVLRDTISARYLASTLVARKLNVTGPKNQKVSGALENAVKGSGVVTIGDKTVSATVNTKISRNGSVVSLSQLTREDRVTAHIKTGAANAHSSNEALDIIADGPDEGEVHGLIAAINGNQVTVTPNNGTPDVTVNVTADTMIEVDGDHATLGDLVVGMQVEASYDPATFDAFSIEADSEGEQDDAHIHGTVAAVDTGAGTLTITPNGGGADVTLNVDASTEIEVNDVHGTLDDIQVGMPVEAEYDTQTMLAKEIKAGSGDDNHEDEEVEGTVAAVDTGANTVTITPKGGGSDITLNVTTETEIEVNGEPATIADITVGQSIKAEYDPSTLNAFEIKVGDDDGGGHEDEHVEGTVAAVDTDANTVTITPNEGADITLNVTEETKIEVNDESATLADVQVGEPVRAEYEVATLNAKELKVGDSGDDH